MKKIVITGGTSGLGFELAKAYLKDNHQVTIIGRNKEKLNHALETLKAFGHVTGYAFDITDISSIHKFKEEIESIDLLINNAGLGYFGSLECYSESQIHHMIDINLKGTIFMTQILHDVVNDQIMNIISTAGLKGKVNESVYVASKFGVRGFTESLQKELSLQVTPVYMGGMATPFWDDSDHIKDMNRLKSPQLVAQEIIEKNDGRDEIIIEK